MNPKLHNKKDHPVYILKKVIQQYFIDKSKYNVKIYDDLDPIVETKNNFDFVLIPEDHPCRSKSDTYYVDDMHCLRTHMTAHWADLIDNLKSDDMILMCGDVYRKDEVDKYHHNCFHQIDGLIRIKRDVKDQNFFGNETLHSILLDLANYLFPQYEKKISSDYFPFTTNSIEMNILKEGKWVEILGAGIVRDEIKKFDDDVIIAFGLGIDRYCMLLFDIPDIRYIWSDDSKFLNQFQHSDDIETIINMKFKQYSKLDNIYKDVSMYISSIENITDSWNNLNSFYDTIRDICDNWIESIQLHDKYHNTKINKISHMYRLTFSPYDTTLSDPEKFNNLVNGFMMKIRSEITKFDDILLR